MDLKICETGSFDKSVHFSLNFAHFIAANSFRFRRKALPSLDKDQSALQIIARIFVAKIDTVKTGVSLNSEKSNTGDTSFILEADLGPPT